MESQTARNIATDQYASSVCRAFKNSEMIEREMQFFMVELAETNYALDAIAVRLATSTHNIVHDEGDTLFSP